MKLSYKFKMLLLGAFLTSFFVACKAEMGITKSPEITVSYIEDPSAVNLVALLKEYRIAVNQYDGKMPGLHADYAMLLLKVGKKEEAIKQLDIEAKLYPESKKYVDYLKSTIK